MSKCPFIEGVLGARASCEKSISSVEGVVLCASICCIGEGNLFSTFFWYSMLSLL